MTKKIEKKLPSEFQITNEQFLLYKNIILQIENLRLRFKLDLQELDNKLLIFKSGLADSKNIPTLEELNCYVLDEKNLTFHLSKPKIEELMNGNP